MIISDTAVFSEFPTKSKIQSFKELKNGWHYGEGVSFGQSILDKAITLHQEAIRLALFETDAFPGLNGEVMFTIYFENHYLEFTLKPDDRVTFYREKKGEEVCYQEGLSFEEAKTKIGEFRKEIWKASASLIRGITTDVYKGSQVSPSIIQGTILEFQSSVENVYF